MRNNGINRINNISPFLYPVSVKLVAPAGDWKDENLI